MRLRVKGFLSGFNFRIGPLVLKSADPWVRVKVGLGLGILVGHG